MVRVLAEAKKEDRGETPKEIFEANLLDGLRKGTYDNLVVEMEVSDVPQAMELVPGGAAISIGASSATCSRTRKRSARFP